MLKFSDKLLLFPIWTLSLLPLKVLYGIARLIYFFVYHIAGYRRKVVYENLRRSFPEKPEKEIEKITKGFYVHLCHSVAEVIHMIRMTSKEIDRRYKVTNPELLVDLYKKNKSIVATGSHYGNWEWAAYLGYLFEYKLLGVYKPLTNKLFDRFFIYLRSRMGGHTVPMNSTLRAIMESQRNKENFIVYLIGDQRPPYREAKEWLTFMNQDTPVITGSEKLARRFNLTTIFVDIKQVKRGYYEVTFQLINENSRETNDLEITKQYFQLVEGQIKRKPELYLWSHKRWKFKKEEMPGVKK